MSKPSWSNAPEWANYLAMDESGEWFWFEFEPSLGQTIKEWLHNKGRSSLAGKTDRSWIGTLETRPE